MIRLAGQLLALLMAASPGDSPGCPPAGHERYEPRTFLGYACDDDCESHKAGLRWAEQQALADPDQCHALPRLAAQGCAAYVDEGGDAAAAGARWAIENEIAHQCDCRGAGERFFIGCVRQLLQPIDACECTGNGD